MGGKSETKTQAVTKREPWEPARPLIGGGMKEVRDLQNSDAGKYYYDGQTYVPMSDTTGNALNAIENRAMSGSDLSNTANNRLLDMINKNNGPANDFYQGGMNGSHNVSTDGYNRFLSTQNPGNGFYNDIAGGSNPYLDATYDKVADKIRTGVNSNFSKAGRYGSHAHQEQLQEGLTDAATNLYGSQYNSDMNRRMAAAGALDNNYNADQARAFGATNAISGIDSANRASRYAAADRATADDHFNRSEDFRVAMSSPMMDQNAYNNYDRLLRVGAAREGYDMQPITQDMNKYFYEQEAPFKRAGFFGGQSGIYGNLGGTNTTNSTTTQSQSGIGPAFGNIMGGLGFASQFLPSFNAPGGSAQPGMTALDPNSGAYGYQNGQYWS